MTTQTWTSRLRHDSDATFREWGLDFNARLAACGMVQTSDTGQINWASVTRPGTNTDGGFEVWRFADSLQATAPIFLRIAYGTAGTTTTPRIQITAGTGSNGSGTITGTALTTARTIGGSGGQTTDTGRASYMCHTTGFFGVFWKVGSGQDACFWIDRTVDNSGVKSVTGALVHWGNGTNTGWTARQALRFASTAAAYTAQTAATAGALGLMAQAQASTLVGSDTQVALAFSITPRAVPQNGICGVYPSEYTAGATFSATLVAGVSHTYLTLAAEAGPFGPITSTGSAGYMAQAMLFE